MNLAPNGRSEAMFCAFQSDCFLVLYSYKPSLRQPTSRTDYKALS
jgi:hypothetical protein